MRVGFFLLCVLLQAPLRADDTIQFLTDPFKPEQAWLLNKSGLQFNANTRKGGKWEPRFNRTTFKKVTGITPDSSFAFLRMQPSKKEPGVVFLIVENKKQRQIFVGREFGRVWKTSGSPPTTARGNEESVDLEELNSAPVVATAPSVAPAPAAPSLSHVSAGPPSYVAPTVSGAGPMFKFMFDFWLYNRPGVTPLTFSNVHTLALVDVTPSPELVFAFELAPTPRFYEITYKLTPRLEVRGGRIWIPFDTIGPAQPHNLFGGLVNVSQFRQPGGSAFLPDIWTDLGLALKFRALDRPRFRMDIEAFVVNGFQAGGSDPAGEIGTKYPNFENSGVVDNNPEKSLGARISTQMFGVLSVGASGYWGRYTDPTDEWASLFLIGLDAQLRLPTGTDIKFGYLYGDIGLIAAASKRSARKGGTYLEGSQRLSQRVKVFVRGGTAQNDSRTVSVNDITMVGGGVVYNRGFIQLSFMYQRDLNFVAAKTTYEFSALRAMVVF